MSRAKQLAQRRSLLVTECALQRITLAGQTSSVTNWINSGNRLVDRFKHLPAWVGALVVGIVIVAPGRALALAKNGLLLLQLWRAVSSKSNSP